MGLPLEAGPTCSDLSLLVLACVFINPLLVKSQGVPFSILPELWLAEEGRRAVCVHWKDVIHSLILQALGRIHSGLLCVCVCVCVLTASIPLGFLYMIVYFNSFMPPWTWLNSHLPSSSSQAFSPGLLSDGHVSYILVQGANVRALNFLPTHLQDCLLSLFALCLPSPAYYHIDTQSPGGWSVKWTKLGASSTQIGCHRELKYISPYNYQT